MKYLLILLLTSCATTERFKTRKAAESFLINCMSMYNEPRFCAHESAKWCQKHSLEASCAVDDLFTRTSSRMPWEH